ncbi:MarR family transcriptional regulator, organic hydroperoxide resistance regulator [Janthinobacterium sp. CG_23.3]|uniref:MarR family winged helix-turn-helix transcriptional regulator n=1 Tax=Janthinobacterium sp. CG_23.3 TaxID=3349634 RepID=UPI0038D3CEE3
MKPGLGTQLRHLIELLDGAVARAYVEAGLSYRPRYTPVMRALIRLEPSSIGQIAELAGITQPAATQTIALMSKEGLVSVQPGPVDGRQRLIRLTEQGRVLLPKLQACWQANGAAAAALDAELASPLSEALGNAIAALEAKPFGARIAEARARLAASERADRQPQDSFKKM